MSIVEIFVLSIVEGLTEFLPISSTGHLIAVSALMGIAENEVVKNFNIIIQAGAIFSVLVLYPRRFFPIRLSFYLRLVVAFLPAAVIGLLVKNKVDAMLDDVSVVASTLVLGGVVLIFFDRFDAKRPVRRTLETLSFRDCASIGLIQCLAFIPGVSRAGATIIGGMLLGLDKKEAAEFSFFLGVPTLFGAFAIKSLQAYKQLKPEHLQAYGIGLVLSFIVGAIAIRFFVSMVQKSGFRYFGWYRIAVGVLLFALLLTGKI